MSRALECCALLGMPACVSDFSTTFVTLVFFFLSELLEAVFLRGIPVPRRACTHTDPYICRFFRSIGTHTTFIPLIDADLLGLLTADSVRAQVLV